jgi:hypothetical protein
MVASQDIAEGSPVLYVPEELIMSSSKAMAAYRSNVMEGAERQLQITGAMTEIKQFYLMIQLLVEIERGAERYVKRTNFLDAHNRFDGLFVSNILQMPNHSLPPVHGTHG